MPKYAVALISFFDNENKIRMVEADDEAGAMIKVAIELMELDHERDADYILSLKGKSAERIQEIVADVDMSISRALLIE